MYVVPLDVASETSSKDDRSKTEASSIDLEWEHEAGMLLQFFCLLKSVMMLPLCMWNASAPFECDVADSRNWLTTFNYFLLEFPIFILKYPTITVLDAMLHLIHFQYLLATLPNVGMIINDCLL